MTKGHKRIKLMTALEALKRLIARGGSNGRKAQGMLDWCREHGDLTQKQRAYACQMLTWSIADDKAAKEAGKATHYLYAIGDGQSIKLGFSVNPKSRMAALQTSHPKKLAILWTMKIEGDAREAKCQEKRLHNHCHKHRIRGEWFSLSCAPLVETFLPDDPTDEEMEMGILCEAMDRI